MKVGRGGSVGGWLVACGFSVGAGGIGYDLVMSMRLFQYERLLLIALAIYLVVTALDRASDSFRRRILNGRKQ